MRPNHNPWARSAPVIRALAVLALSAALLIGPAAAYAQPDAPLTISVFPRRNAALTMRLFSPLARYLENELGRQVHLRTSANFDSFMRSLELRRFDLIHLNQYQYILAHDKYGYEAIAQNEELGETGIKSAIFARKSSNIENLADLRGRRIIFGGNRSAMMSYILPTFLLREAGLGAGDYQELFAVNPPNAMIAAYLGRADACGVGEVVIRLPMLRSKFNSNELRPLATSDPLPHLPWAVPADMPPALRQRLQSLLLDLEKSAEGQHILESAQLTGFNAATDADYHSHRAIVRRVLSDSE
jgi:phosphonate transport system substrate-binding protein